MALAIVGDTLFFKTSPSYIQVYNTNTLLYEEIDEVVDGSYAVISPDNLGITVTPVSQSGEQTYTVRLVNGQEVNIPLYFQSPYYKQPEFINSYQAFYPPNMLRFYQEDPDTAVAVATDELFNQQYYSGDLIPLTNEFNETFPQYCSNQLSGIAICLAYSQWVKDNEDINWIRVYKYPWGFSNNLDDYVFTGSNPTDEDEETGKFHQIEYAGQTLRLKYGALANGNFLGAGRALYFQVDPANGATGEILQDWENTQGLPITCETIYNLEPFSVDEDAFQFKILPSFSRFQIGEYRPDQWFNNTITAYGEEFIIKFDGTDFQIGFLGEAKSFTFDSDDILESLDYGVWV